MVAPEPSPPAGRLSNAQSRQKPPAPSLPKRPRPKTDVTIVMHVCRLFDAPWRCIVKAVGRRSVLLPIAVGIVAVPLHTGVPGAQEGGALLSDQALREIAQVEAEIDRVEAQTIERLGTPPDNQVQQVELLGKLLLYDKYLSVNRNEACPFCPIPATRLTAPPSELNPTTRSY